MPGVRRLLCLMLTLLLALPAVQARACSPDLGHGTTSVAMLHGEGDHGTHHTPAPQPEPQSQKHDCLGCIAPIDLDSARPVDRLSFAIERATRSPEGRFPANAGSPPEPPPPRILV